MFHDVASIADDSVLTADVVIVGAGAAGISIARELADRSLQVVLLESGGMEYEEASQDLYKGRIAGFPNEATDATRLRYFGGTTNHWAGWCRPLDAGDFAGAGGEAWPFGLDVLAPYYERAAEICELGPAKFDDLEFWQNQDGGGQLQAMPTDADKLTTAIFQVSPPTRFGEAYGEQLRTAANVSVILGANVLSLLPGGSADPGQERKRVAGVSVASLDGRRFTVQGRAVVIATGGLEAPRLMLLSTGIHPNGAGNEHDLVGRYFQDHIWLERAAYLSFSNPPGNWPLYFDRHELGGATMLGTLASTAAVRRQENIGGFRLVLQPEQRSHLGMTSAGQLADALGDGRVPSGFWDHIGNVFSDLDQIADKGYRAVFGGSDSPFFSKPGPSDPIVGALIDLNFEQTPNPDSRVRLDERSTAVDALGQRRLVMDWQLGERDMTTAKRALDLLAQEAGRMGIGRVRTLEAAPLYDAIWPETVSGSRHHMGTARMANDPANGVTDGWGRVHSTENLYVAGSALFPSSGHANPTLTIVALALRQAEHLVETLR